MCKSSDPVKPKSRFARCHGIGKIHVRAYNCIIKNGILIKKATVSLRPVMFELGVNDASEVEQQYDNQNVDLPFYSEKVSAPVLGELVERRAIVAAFKKADPQVVWISSPGGSGKTAAALQLAHASQRLLLWYNLDSIDNDPAVFFNSLRQTLVSSGVKADGVPEMIADDLRHLRSFAVYFFSRIKASLGNDYVLVLDNYQLLHAEAPLHYLLVSAILSQLPDICVIVTSREEMPSPWLRLDVDARLLKIGWPQLRIDNDEIGEFLCAETELADLRHDPEVMASLARNSDGWVAGLKLLLVMLRHQSGKLDLERLEQGRYQIFRYFSSEVISGMASEAREVLLKASRVPFIPLSLAGDLCEDERAGKIIQDLFRGHFFISRHESERHAGEECFVLHDLLRDYLSEEFKSSYSETRRRELLYHAGQLFQQNGWHQEALQLFLDAEAWREGLDLIEELAPLWVYKGRTASLLSLIEQMPQEYRTQRAIVEYWYGLCLLPGRLGEAYDHLNSAYAEFKKAGNLPASIRSWAAIINTLWLTSGDYWRLDPWIQELDALHQGAGDDDGLQQMLAHGAFTALSLRRLDHPDMPYWEALNLQMLDQGGQPLSDTILRGLQMMIYYTWGIGDRAKSTLVMEYLHYAMNDERCSETAQCVYRNMASAHSYWFSPQVEECLEHVEVGLAKAAEYGVPFWDVLLINTALLKLCSVEDVAGARSYLERLTQSINETSSANEVAVFYNIKGYIGWLKGDLPGALAAAEKAMELALACGLAFSPVYYRMLIARIKADMGETRAALRLIAESRRQAKAFRSDCLLYASLMASADILQAAGRVERAMGYARPAFEIGERQRYYAEYYVRRGGYRTLCRHALSAGPESQYLRDRLELLSEEVEPLCRIRTLGRFAIERVGQTAAGSRKQAKVPMQLLLRLIAAGEGNNLGSEALIESLWPGTEFRKGYPRLKTTVQRLRGMLGADDALLFRDGRLHLNGALCEVDAWRFESRRKTLDALDEGQLQQLFDIYQGPFCDQLNEDEEVLIYRSTLETRFEALANRMAENHGRRDEWGQALEIHQQALKRCPYNSSFVSGVAQCLSRLGRERELEAFMRSIDAS